MAVNADPSSFKLMFSTTAVSLTLMMLAYVVYGLMGVDRHSYIHSYIDVRSHPTPFL